jgi:hypothetical protein
VPRGGGTYIAIRSYRGMRQIDAPGQSEAIKPWVIHARIAWHDTSRGSSCACLYPFNRELQRWPRAREARLAFPERSSDRSHGPRAEHRPDSLELPCPAGRRRFPHANPRRRPLERHPSAPGLPAPREHRGRQGRDRPLGRPDLFHAQRPLPSEWRSSFRRLWMTSSRRAWRSRRTRSTRRSLRPAASSSSRRGLTQWSGRATGAGA